MSDELRTEFINHKRYQMSDISKLEQRIKNLEYYTSLNQLESTTLNQFIPDANGLNRFRSGIFVDNFGSLDSQDLDIGAKNSIDRREGILRPSHYTTAFNLQVGNTSIAGIGTTTRANQDSRFESSWYKCKKKWSDGHSRLYGTVVVETTICHSF